MLGLSVGLLILIAVLVLLLVLGGGALLLVKLGVITHYALKPDPPEPGDFGLDQSRAPGDETS